MLQKANVIKILNYNGLPKHITKWNRDVTYFPEDIVIGRPALLYYDSKVIATSNITDIEKNENNLVLSTENSVYYIKKYIK